MKSKRAIKSWDDVPIVMDLPMASRIVGTTPETLKKRCQQGRFPGYKEGGLWRVDKDALREYIAAQRVVALPLAKGAKT